MSGISKRVGGAVGWLNGQVVMAVPTAAREPQPQGVVGFGIPLELDPAAPGSVCNGGTPFAQWSGEGLGAGW